MRSDIQGRIFLAARNVFARQGYRSTTVSDILQEANVARGTFYRYYPNKRQVFYDLMSSLFNGISEASSAIVNNDGNQLAGHIHDSFAHCYRLFIDNRGLLLTYMREGITLDTGLYALWDEFDKRMTTLFSGVLSKGIDSGEFRQVDNELVSRAMLMLFLQVPYRDIMLAGHSSIDVDSLAGEMASFVLEGLGARPANDRRALVP
jgi:AcrR family transcriptional regulator